jgi:hypothetical protein
VLQVSSEFCVDVKKYKYKGVTRVRITIMEHVFIYRYISFAFGILFIVGFILFMWVALRRIHNVPHRWVIYCG